MAARALFVLAAVILPAAVSDFRRWLRASRDHGMGVRTDLPQWEVDDLNSGVLKLTDLKRNELEALSKLLAQGDVIKIVPQIELAARWRGGAR